MLLSLSGGVNLDYILCSSRSRIYSMKMGPGYIQDPWVTLYLFRPGGLRPLPDGRDALVAAGCQPCSQPVRA